MRTCYLHLGMPKTGSSSIQAAFQGFDSPTLCYARLRGSNHGPLICTAFSTNPQRLREARRGRTQRLRDLLRPAPRQRLLKSLPRGRNVILSGEIMVDRLNDEEFADMVATLREHVGRVVAIAYIRPLASLAASQFQQRVKTGHREFFIPSPDYRKRFEKVTALFQPEDIIWRRFDRADLRGGDIVEDFAHVLGLDRAPQAGVARNESLSTEALAALFAFNRFTAPLLRPALQARTRERLLTALRDVGDTRFALAPDLVKRHIDKHADDIAWMESVCGFDVSGQIADQPQAIATLAQLLDAAARLGSKARQDLPRIAV